MRPPRRIGGILRRAWSRGSIQSHLPLFTASNAPSGISTVPITGRWNRLAGLTSPPPEVPAFEGRSIPERVLAVGENGAIFGKKLRLAQARLCGDDPVEGVARPGERNGFENHFVE